MQLPSAFEFKTKEQKDSEIERKLLDGKERPHYRPLDEMGLYDYDRNLIHDELSLNLLFQINAMIGWNLVSLKKNLSKYREMLQPEVLEIDKGGLWFKGKVTSTEGADFFQHRCFWLNGRGMIYEQRYMAFDKEDCTEYFVERDKQWAKRISDGLRIVMENVFMTGVKAYQEELEEHQQKLDRIIAKKELVEWMNEQVSL